MLVLRIYVVYTVASYNLYANALNALKLWTCCSTVMVD